MKASLESKPANTACLLSQQFETADQLKVGQEALPLASKDIRESQDIQDHVAHDEMGSLLERSFTSSALEPKNISSPATKAFEKVKTRTDPDLSSSAFPALYGLQSMARITRPVRGRQEPEMLEGVQPETGAHSAAGESNAVKTSSQSPGPSAPKHDVDEDDVRKANPCQSGQNRCSEQNVPLQTSRKDLASNIDADPTSPNSHRKSEVAAPKQLASTIAHPTSLKPSQNAILADLKAKRSVLLSSLTKLPAIQVLIEERAASNPSTGVDDSEPNESDVMAAANKIVKDHIKLLHEYNELKDTGQGLMGLIADQRGVRIVEVQDEFGIDATD